MSQPRAMNTMQTYAFTILTTADAAADVVDRLYRVCTDATATSCDGRLLIAFDRDAESLDAAIRSALGDLLVVGCDATTVTIEAESLALHR